ncbi:hypothetical protein J2R98_001427 [Alkalibacillus filiformis]|uniref:DUF3231 family protein n=1 Tax=Alkalibacillus filiformis TaxID=200990 RepID=A0ABU0DTZ3_9BACI|nr:DUF3231 family protein [Alkalibacillus filiformis]MDQ0351610.1 hypothetical protein [Alkalibacillus filiformis]
MTVENIRLTAAEVSELWGAYMNDSLTVCVMKNFLNKVEDDEIKPLVESSLTSALNHLQEIETIFNNEGYPIPVAFSENEDVDINSPRIFSDGYMLEYLREMGQIGKKAYSSAVAFSTRSDVYQYFSNCLQETQQFHGQAVQVSLKQGTYMRPPYLPIPKKPDFVKKQSFLQGWFGDRRPVTGPEVTHLFSNIQRNALGAATMAGFTQTTQSKELRRYFQRGKEIANKHIEIFSSLLRENDLPVPMTWDTEVTDSTSFVFSDKLMLYQTTSLNALGLSYYGLSIANSPRHDLGVHYTRLMAEVAQYTQDGTNMMIDHGWLEQPPQAAERDKLKNE